MTDALVSLSSAPVITGRVIPDDLVAVLDGLLHRGQQFAAIVGAKDVWHVVYVGQVQAH